MLAAMLAAEQAARVRRPQGPALELTSDGWQVWTDQSDTPVPVPVTIAYELAVKSDGNGDVVLDQTRKLCGELRFAAKKRGLAGQRAQQTLNELRAGLAEARQIKTRLAGS